MKFALSILCFVFSLVHGFSLKQGNLYVGMLCDYENWLGLVSKDKAYDFQIIDSGSEARRGMLYVKDKGYLCKDKGNWLTLCKGDNTSALKNVPFSILPTFQVCVHPR